MLWSFEHLVFVLLLSVSVTFIEIFSEFPRRYSIAYKSRHFIFLLSFNIIVGFSLFFINSNNGSKFLNISDPWALSFISGVSGFLLFNSKIDIEKNLNINNISSFKSFISGMRSSLYSGIKEYVEEDYPNELRTHILKNFSYTRIDEYSNFVKDSIEFFTGRNKERIGNMVETLDDINNLSDERKVYYLTRALLEIKNPYWVKKNVADEFCEVLK